MNKLIIIFCRYWIAYIIDAAIFIGLNFKGSNSKMLAIGQIMSWIILTVILIVINRDSHGGYAV